MFGSESLARARSLPGSHTVTFYEEGPRFTDAVRDHVLEGLRKGDGVVLLIKHDHWTGLRPEIEKVGFSVSRLFDEERLVVLEANAALEALRAEGEVSEHRFLTLVEPAWFKASQGGTRPVRAMGELVDLLWQEGAREEAIRLERIWERFLAPRDIKLLCAYCIRLLDDAGRSVEEVADVHDGYVETPDRLRFDDAISAAFDEIVGVEEAGRLRPLVAMDLGFPRRLGMGERTLFWVRRHLPHHAATIMERARVRFQEQPAQA